MTWRDRIAGFYSILDSHDEKLARQLVTPATRGGAGARVLQVRIKRDHPSPTSAEILGAARMARRVTEEAGALLIVNDRLDIALAAHADGVHLGQDDLALADARAVLARLALDRPFLVGISTHNGAQVSEAIRGRADYLGFGPVFSTGTKANPDPVQGIDGLRAAVALAGDTPIVAIGGVTPESAPALATAGAAAAAAISAVNHSENPAVTGSRIGAAFTR